MPALDIKTTLGAILAGGIAAVALSGMAAVQGFLYFRMYPRDPKTVHGLVALVWLLDAVHSTLIAVAIWRYFVLSFDMESQVDLIYPEIAFSVALTAALTFVVHMFFAVRLSRLSKANRYIIAPLVVLALARLGCAIVSTVEMAELRSYHRFLEEVGWVFTLGLSFSSATDIWIVAAMCFYLHMSRTGLGKMDHVIDILLIYTFNNGALTCVTTIITLICWITMDNLTFLGIHFCIAKLYAMSLLITLNTRRSIRRRAEAPADDIDLNVAINLPSFSVYRTRSITTQHPSSIRHSESVAATQIFLDVGKPARTGGHTAAEEDTREQFDRPGIFPALEKECS